MINFSFFILLFLASGLCSSHSLQSWQSHQLLSYFTNQKINIDGDLAEWEGLDNQIMIQDQHPNQGGKHRMLSDNKVTIYSLWDPEYLYLAFYVLDQDLRAVQTEKDHRQLYMDDMVEFLIDPNNDRTDQWLGDDIVYHINAAGAKKDDRGTAEGISNADWDGIAIYAIHLMGSLNDTTDLDNGYSVEIAIPWSELDITPGDNTAIGFNAANGDCDGKGSQLFDWVGAWPFRSPHRFGSLVLVRP